MKRVLLLSLVGAAVATIAYSNRGGSQPRYDLKATRVCIERSGHVVVAEGLQRTDGLPSLSVGPFTTAGDAYAVMLFARDPAEARESAPFGRSESPLRKGNVFIEGDGATDPQLIRCLRRGRS